MCTIIGILTGILLSACNIGISSWQFWAIAILVSASYGVGYKKGRVQND